MKEEIMKEILLPKGKITIIDDKDYNEISKYKWYIKSHGRTWYVYRIHYDLITKKRSSVYLHRQILDLQSCDGKITDHIDRNGLNNTRINLRIVSYQQNAINRRLPKNNKSGFRGVSYSKIHRKWKACIRYNNKTIYLGLYQTPTEAARGYDVKAKELFKRYAILNFPNGLLNNKNLKYIKRHPKTVFNKFLNFICGCIN
jgi:hypothetical protein